MIPPILAIPVGNFLDSIGVNSAIDRRGETIDKTIECANFLGIRWFRSGYEGNPKISDLIELHQKTGAKFSWGFGSGGSDLPKLLATGKQLAASNVLLAFEGPNEPNNWGITYLGETGGRNKSWKPVANLQRDLYQAVHGDKDLKNYPVWSISEGGAEVDNVGLQFLAVPETVQTEVPNGTSYADAANVHNYVYHPNVPGLQDNKTWNAADPSSATRVDGLYGEYGRTWAHHYPGYSEEQLKTLPRVTTETGCGIGGVVTEEIQAKNLLTLYLDQFKRGWSYTAMYLLRDRVDEGGNQKFGFYKPDYSPRQSAVYLHNLTAILADKGSIKHPGALRYRVENEPVTVHDLLLEKHDGTFYLVVWSELLKGENKVTLSFEKPSGNITIFDPTLGVSPLKQSMPSKQLSLSLTDHPLIIEIPQPGKT